jgi:glycerol-3-phosphate dehydrogenase (NAD(P)+)
MTINILGAGSWGLALAHLLSKKKLVVKIWLRSEKKSLELSRERVFSKLPGFQINTNIIFTSNLSDLDFQNLTIIALPSNVVYRTLKKINNFNCDVLICSKGFDPDSTLLLSDSIHESFGINSNKLAVLSGPNHAEEITQNKPSATVIASSNIKLVKSLQLLFYSKDFRVYITNDLIGVQLGGAIKNIISIASGICFSLNMGDNIVAALITRGLNEMLSLEKKYDIDKNTLYGLSGIGDLMATCYSRHSRNRKFGELIGSGANVDSALDEINATVEGLIACKIVNDISLSEGINLPICREVYNILYNFSDPKESINNLMLRKLKDEK